MNESISKRKVEFDIYSSPRRKAYNIKLQSRCSSSTRDNNIISLTTPITITASKLVE